LIDSRPVIVQHFVGIDGGGPARQLELLLQSPLAAKYRFDVVSQDRAAGGINLSLIAKMAEKMSHFTPDLVHVRGLLNGGFHGLVAAQKARCSRILVSVHGIAEDSERKGFLLQVQQKIVHHLLESYTLRNADGVYCVCDYAAKRPFIQRHAHNLLGVIHNGIEVRPANLRNNHVRTELGYSSQDVVGVFVGRVVRDKGLFYLSDAIQHLDAQGIHQPQLMIVGDGPDAKALQQCLSAQIASGRVRFLGHSTNISELLAASDFFVLPSLHENLSNSLLEAAHAGLAILTTSVGGNPEVVVDGTTGLLIAPRNIDALVHGLRWMAEQSAKRIQMGNAGRSRIETHFSMDRTIKELDNIYQIMLARGHSRV